MLETTISAEAGGERTNFRTSEELSRALVF